MKKGLLLFLACTLVYSLTGQTINGVILNQETENPLIGAAIRSGIKGVLTDVNGRFSLQLPIGQHTLKVTHLGYVSQEIPYDLKSSGNPELEIRLEPENSLLDAITISTDRHETPLSEVTISTDIVKPRLLESTNSTSLDDVLSKISGVDIIDGQANIRGGSGYSYGAGSRVLLLIDDIPYLQADAGFPQWDDIPIENIAQVEVVKGAGSALYGSSALNGIINIRTAEATQKPYTKFTTFISTYSRPLELKQTWWERRPFEYGSNIVHREQIGKLSLSVSAFQLNREGFNRTFYDNYNRFSLGLKYRASDRLFMGVNANINNNESGEFFFWKSLDSLYVPFDNTFSNVDATRFNVDPFVHYYDKAGNKHKFLGRFYYVDNQSNNNQSNGSQLGYGEYQFQRKFDSINVKVTAGAVYSTYLTVAELYGDTSFTSQNIATYAQVGKGFGARLNLSAGFRYEHNTLRAPELFGCAEDPFTQEIVCDTVPNGRVVDAKPVFRLGGNYKAARATFIRASWGQGYRFPTIAERFVKTTFGGIPISPNPDLIPETGWSSEIGVKQGYRLGKLKGFIDVSGFWSRYENMMEFNLVDIFPTGFMSVNVGGTDIKGLEFTLAGNGKIGETEHSFLIGHTRIDPRFQEFDTSPEAYVDPQTEGQRNAYGSSSKTNVLKYRYRQTVKADWEVTYKRWSVAASANYYSFMEAVDAPFESVIVPGLATFREDHKNGDWIVGFRASGTFLKDRLKASFIANNVLNHMYSLRPGLMEAPRSLSLRLEYKL